MSENKFETIEQRVSYGVGRQLGDQLRNNPFKDFDITAVQAGIAHYITKFFKLLHDLHGYLDDRAIK